VRSVVRVRREERERSGNAISADAEVAIQKCTPEMIVKSWIAASRERRRADALAYQQNREWNQKLCLSESQ
jgi:hypothetical protein